MLRRLFSFDFVLEHPELPWLPTEQEKINFYDLLGRELKKIKISWPDLHYRTAPGMLILEPSTPAILPTTNQLRLVE